jgi:hypothetical protein
VDAGRLDYLVRWAEAKAPLQHRAVSDEITDLYDTPGARLSNAASDRIHVARREEDFATYSDQVEAALDYRIDIVERALAVLENVGSSRLRNVHQALEGDAQVVWRRRLALQASDLVRFSRTYPTWRNSMVDMLDADRRCHAQLACLSDPSVALELAADAGMRELARATVVGVGPSLLRVNSRRLGGGVRVVALYVNGRSLVEDGTANLRIQSGSFKLSQLPIAVLQAQPGEDALLWSPRVPTPLVVGDELILADAGWFGKEFASGHEIAVTRPAVDKRSAPTATCTPDTYAWDPEAHNWCCKPHTVAEAEWSDTLAARRAAGELNPDVWPPLVDEERFDVGPDDEGAPLPPSAPPDGLTMDDVD